MKLRLLPALGLTLAAACTDATPALPALPTLQDVQPHATAGAAEQPVPSNVLYLLSSFEALPTRQQLESLFPNSPTNRLMQIITSTSTTLTAGVRLRAIRALGQLPETLEVRTALLQLLAQYATAYDGIDLLYLMAIVETIGQLGTADEVDAVVSLLPHPSRDIRIAAARALRLMGNVAAVTPLRNRGRDELVESVKLEISETLQVLDPRGL